MPKLDFANGLAIVGLVFGILLVVLDKAGKLKGPILYVLLGVAACLTFPLVAAVLDTISAGAIPLFARWLLTTFSVGLIYSLLVVWISSSPLVPSALVPSAASEEKPREQVKSPPQAKPPAVRSKPLAPSEKSPTLLSLFTSDFPNLIKASDDALGIQWNDGSILHIKRQLYLDFPGKSQFVGFYIPYPMGGVSAERTFNAGMRLADEVTATIEGISSKVDSSAGDASGATHMRDLTFSGRVYIYHEEPLSNQQRATIINEFGAKHFDVSFRGPDYLGPLLVEWHHKHDPQRSAH